MSIYARIYDDQVFEFVEVAGDISTMYHPSMVWVCMDSIKPMPSVGWSAIKVDGTWQFAPLGPVIVTPEQQAEAVAAERFRREASVVYVDGCVVKTDRESAALVYGLGFSALRDPDYCCNFKAVNGFFELGSEPVLKIAEAVRAYVDACFDREKQLSDLIASGHYSDDMLTEGWPDSSPPDPADLQ